jgi:hypothetical protein
MQAKTVSPAGGYGHWFTASEAYARAVCDVTGFRDKYFFAWLQQGPQWHEITHALRLPQRHHEVLSARDGAVRQMLETMKSEGLVVSREVRTFRLLVCRPR